MLGEYKYILIEDGREPRECIENKYMDISDKNLIIRDEIRNKYRIYQDLEDYEKDYPYLEEHLTHEVIFGYRKQKPKFDIDGGNEETYEKILEGIKEEFLKEYEIKINYVEYDSSNEKTFSRHIVVTNVLFANSKEADNFTKKKLSKLDKYKNLDKGINKMIQNFRMPGSVKNGRKKEPFGVYMWEDGIVSINNEEIPILEEKIREEKEDYKIEEIDKEKELIIKEKIGPEFVYRSTKNNIIIYDRIRKSYCGICKREHEREGIYVCVLGNKIIKRCFRQEGKVYEIIWREEFNILGIMTNQCELATWYINKMKEKIKISEGKIYKWEKEKKIWEVVIIGKIIRDVSMKINKILKRMIETENAKEIPDGKRIEKIGQGLKYNTKTNYIREMLEQAKSELTDEKFGAELDSVSNEINFRNGIYDLRQGLFRERTMEDKVSKYLDYEYKEEIDKEKVEEIKKIYLKISNDDKNLREFMFQWQGYCLTGEIRARSFLVLIGHKASNGKSTIFKIFTDSFPIYAIPIDNRTFNKDYQKSHKIFTELKYPIRFAYMEEMNESLLNIALLKSWVSEAKIENEILYGTTEIITSQAKIGMTSNHILRFEVDNGVKERGIMAELTNKFIAESEYKRLKEIPKGIYKRDPEILEKFKKDEYKLALFSILKEKAKEFYEKGWETPEELKVNFEELCDENDEFKRFIEITFDITGKDEDRIGKERFVMIYNEYMKTKKQWKDIMDDVKRSAIITYDKAKRIDNIRGVIIGLKEKDIK